MDNKTTRPNGRKREQALKVNQRRHTKRRRKSYTIQYIIITGLILITGIILSVTVFFNMESIIVEGNVTHTQEEIATFSQAKIGGNLFRQSMNKISSNILEATVDIDEVSAERRLPSTLAIVIKQATPIAAYYSGTTCNIISTGGRIIAQVPDLTAYPDVMVFSSAALSEYKLGDFLNEVPEYQTIKTVVDALIAAQIDKIGAMEITDNDEIKLSFDNRITIELGGVKDVDYKLQTVKKVISGYYAGTEQGTIDARTVGTAYFRPMVMEKQIQEGIAVKAEGIVTAPVAPPAAPPADADTATTDDTEE